MKTLKIMLWILLSLTALVVLASGNQEKPRLDDAEIRQRIVGTWLVDLKSHSGKSMDGSVSFLSNGTCSAEAVIIKDELKNELHYECAWEVKDGFLIETVMKTNNPRLISFGKITRDYVILLDAKQFVYQSENGKIQARQRKKTTK